MLYTVPVQSSVTKRNSDWPCVVWFLSVKEAERYWIIFGCPDNFFKIFISCTMQLLASSSAASSLWNFSFTNPRFPKILNEIPLMRNSSQLLSPVRQTRQRIHLEFRVINKQFSRKSILHYNVPSAITFLIFSWTFDISITWPTKGLSDCSLVGVLK